MKRCSRDNEIVRDSSTGYQIMDKSRHTETKKLNYKKNHEAINGKLLKNVPKDLYEVELVKLKIRHNEPIIVVFFIIQHTKLRMLQLYYILLIKFAMCIHSRSLKCTNLNDCVPPSKKTE